VLVGEDPDEAAPDEAFEARLHSAAHPVADRKREPEREGDPEQVGAAPTDTAFEQIGINGSNCAEAGSTPAVTNVLLYHVAKGRRDAADVTRSSRIRMLNGEFTRISSNEGAYFVNDSRIIATDVFASNGVIHAIDKVLLPA
jgi:hypothetical protein